MSKLEPKFPFMESSIEGVKDLDDMKRVFKDFVKAHSVWYAKYYDNVENGGFETNSWRTDEQENGDLKLQRKIGDIWTDAGTVSGSSTLGDMQFVNDINVIGSSIVKRSLCGGVTDQVA